MCKSLHCYFLLIDQRVQRGLWKKTASERSCLSCRPGKENNKGKNLTVNNIHVHVCWLFAQLALEENLSEKVWRGPGEALWPVRDGQTSACYPYCLPLQESWWLARLFGRHFAFPSFFKPCCPNVGDIKEVIGNFACIRLTKSVRVIKKPLFAISLNDL